MSIWDGDLSPEDYRAIYNQKVTGDPVFVNWQDLGTELAKPRTVMSPEEKQQHIQCLERAIQVIKVTRKSSFDSLEDDYERLTEAERQKMREDDARRRIAKGEEVKETKVKRAAPKA